MREQDGAHRLAVLHREVDARVCAHRRGADSVAEGVVLPGTREGDDVPPPYKDLLVHSADMTGTLERFYGKTVGLAVLSRELQKDSYLREVVLHVDEEQRPVEYGVIQIYLRHFPATARRRVLEEQAPLGGILNSEAVGYLSWPQAFFCLESDAHIKTVLRLAQPSTLHGRRNVLLDGSRRLLAGPINFVVSA